jgi:signal transduction histidine kinase
MVLWVVLVMGLPAASPAPDTATVNRLNRNATAMRETQPDSALRLSKEAAEIASAISYEAGLAKALENTAWIYYRKGDFAQSMDLSYQALAIAARQKDSIQIAQLYNNVGAIYFAQSQFKKALVEFSKALAIARAAGHLPLEARSTNNISFMHASLKQYDSAEHYAHRAIGLATRLNNGYSVAFAYRNLGDALLATGREQQALSAFRLGMDRAREANAVSVVSAIQPRLARVLLKNKNFDEAYALLTANIALCLQHGFMDELLVSYRLLADWYRVQKRFAEASDVQHQYLKLSDSVQAMKWSSQVASLQARFELDMKEAQIGLLEKEQELSRSIILRQRILLAAVLIGLVIIVAAALVFWYSVRKIRLANLEIERQRVELERLNDTKDKLFSIIGHDLRSPLHSLKGLLSLFAQESLTPQEFAHYSKDLKNRIDVVYNSLDNLLHWSAAQISGIKTNPKPVNVSELFREVIDLYDEPAAQKQIQVQVEAPADVHVLADRDQLLLVLRNLQSNAIKFSHVGGRVMLGVCPPENGLATLYVSDEGVGIDPALRPHLMTREALRSQQGTGREKGLGIGLLLCKEFLEKNNSRLEVESRPGSGTRFSFSLPLANQLRDAEKQRVALL